MGRPSTCSHLGEQTHAVLLWAFMETSSVSSKSLHPVNIRPENETLNRDLGHAILTL